MEEITLSFDISQKHLGYEEATTLRHEISDQLDNALKDASAGRWTGATNNLVRMEIFLKATNPEKAIEIIKSVLTDHWMFRLM